MLSRRSSPCWNCCMRPTVKDAPSFLTVLTAAAAVDAGGGRRSSSRVGPAFGGTARGRGRLGKCICGLLRPLHSAACCDRHFEHRRGHKLPRSLFRQLCVLKERLVGQHVRGPASYHRCRFDSGVVVGRLQKSISCRDSTTEQRLDKTPC